MSRRAVRKVARSGETAFCYERSSKPQPRIAPWRDQLHSLRAANAARASRKRLTPIRISEELRGPGHEDGHDAVRRYAAA